VPSPYAKAWRTYNILIRRNPAGSHPYTITYVINRHQNDARSSKNGALGTPHFFVTVNPPFPIPDSHVLRQPDGTPAKTIFHHIAHDLDAIKAQERRDNLQGTNNVYITGGYARGAGLHEECWADVMEVAAQIKRVQEHYSAYDSSN
jgi:predicted NAD/FAD-binding protein